MVTPFKFFSQIVDILGFHIFQKSFSVSVLLPYPFLYMAFPSCSLLNPILVPSLSPLTPYYISFAIEDPLLPTDALIPM